MKIIAPKHNQEKESKENWGNFSCEKMKVKKIEREKKQNTTIQLRAHEIKSNENFHVLMMIMRS